MPFRDRADAGRRLGAELARRPGAASGGAAVVLGLPRGGVPVAFAVARAIDAPLDVVVVRKLGVPSQPELAMGAIAEDGARVLDGGTIAAAGVRPEELAAVETAERARLEERAELLRRDRARVDVAGRTVIVVDDGVATGSTARAACASARRRGARRVVLAVPVAPRSVVGELSATADEVVCLETPRHFVAVGQYYRDFSPTSDDEVAELLREADRAADGRMA